MAKKLKVVQFGLGPIGIATAQTVLEKQSMSLVGGIDLAEHLVGRDLGEILGQTEKMGMVISADAAEVLKKAKPDVVLHTTSSFLDRVEDQLMACIEAGAHVVSSTEELFYPYHRNKAFCKRIDEAAKAKGVVVVGTGVNPGFSMDVLPLTLSGICTQVERVNAWRIVDASKRRKPLQQKIGAGLSKKEFKSLVEQGKLGHIGLRESLLAIADGLGWKPDEIEEKIKPVMATKRIKTPYVRVEEGQVAGIRHTCKATVNGKTIIDLELQMYVGAKSASDNVEIKGTPPIDMCIDGGIFGDTATVAAIINTAGRVAAAAPGLRTMLDLSIPRAFL